MQSDCDSYLTDLSGLACNLSGLDAEQAARALRAFLLEVAIRIGWEVPDLDPPGTLDGAGDGWTVTWPAWEWVPGLVSRSGIVGRGYLPLRGPMFFTAASVASSPTVQLWAPDSGIPQFVTQPYGDLGIVFYPRILFPRSN